MCCICKHLAFSIYGLQLSSVMFLKLKLNSLCKVLFPNNLCCAFCLWVDESLNFLNGTVLCSFFSHAYWKHLDLVCFMKLC